MADRIPSPQFFRGGCVLAAAAVLVGAVMSGGAGEPTEVLGVQFSATTTTVTSADGTAAEAAAETASSAPPATAPESAAATPNTPAGSVQPTSTTALTAAVAPTGAVTGSFTVAGRGIGGVAVTLVDALGGQRSTTTDMSGSFRLSEVVAGTYRLELADPGDDAPLCDALGSCVTTRPLRVESRTVEVTAGEESSVEVEL